MSDQEVQFIDEAINFVHAKFMALHKCSTPYHPQENGQAEITNKTLCTSLTNVVSETIIDWEQKLHSILWACHVAYKTSIGTTPFDLVYGFNAIFPMEFLVPTL